MTHTISNKTIWILILSSSLIFAITMGARQTLGLFIFPINHTTQMDIVSISFSLAIGQFVWGLSQPIFGAIADKKGSWGVLVLGALLLSLGLVLTTISHNEWMLLLSIGIISAAGAGAGSFSVLIGAISAKLPPQKSSFAGGFINAGGSFGQFIFAPILQAIIQAFGWIVAMLSMAITTLLTIPLASILTKNEKTTSKPLVLEEQGLLLQIKNAFKDKSYIYLHIGFFTCGFHIAFLVTHLPGEVALCGFSAQVSASSLAIIGLFNIAGSLYAGHLGSVYKMKYILAAMYASRALMIILYLLSDKTPMTFYIFSAFLGFTWLATVPPTVGIVRKLFGIQYLATLFGLTLLTHQIGAFFGAWLGGLVISNRGDYSWMWYMDILLALLAAVINLPIKEEAVNHSLESK